MRSRTDPTDADARPDQSTECNRGQKSPGREETPYETAAESDESSDLAESDLLDADDDRWDVFILDDDDPLPDYGDFWMPD